MDGERLRDRQLLQVRFLTVELRHIRRRGRGRAVEQIPEQPDAALDRMAVLAVREAGEDAGVRQDAAAVEALVESPLAKLRVHDARDAVMRRQAVVNAREVGVEELED